MSDRRTMNPSGPPSGFQQQGEPVLRVLQLLERVPAADLVASPTNRKGHPRATPKQDSQLRFDLGESRFCPPRTESPRAGCAPPSDRTALIGCLIRLYFAA